MQALKNLEFIAKLNTKASTKSNKTKKIVSGLENKDISETIKESKVHKIKDANFGSQDYYKDSFDAKNVIGNKIILDKRTKKIVAPNRSFELPIKFEMYSSNEDGTNFSRVVLSADFLGLNRTLSRYLDKSELSDRSKIKTNLEKSYNDFIRNTTQEVAKMLRAMNKNNSDNKEFYIELR